MPKVSVIVPVYKAENYIRRCLDSLLAQTMPDFELLLIDDGSPDRSGAICDEYAEKDSRIRVFHKENGGVASARQMGIENAIGEYSIHCDPDDWAEPDMLEELYAKAKETDADMVICDFYENRQAGQRYVSQHIPNMHHSSVLEHLVAGTLHGSTWNKLIRNCLYRKYSVKFPLQMTYCEDLFVVCSLLQHAIKVAYLPNAFYHYDMTVNVNSLSATARPLSKEAVDSLIYFTDYFSDNISFDRYKDAIECRMCYTKTIMWYSQYYPRRYFVNKYEAINKLLIEKSCHEEGKQTKSLVLALRNNWGYFFARTIESAKKVLLTK